VLSLDLDVTFTIGPQAGAVSHIRRRIFVRQKSLVSQILLHEKNTVTLLLYQYARQWRATELKDGPCDPTFQNFQLPIYIVIPLFASEKYFDAALQPYLRKNIGGLSNFSRIFYLS